MTQLRRESPIDYPTWAARFITGYKQGDEGVIRWATSQYVECTHCRAVVFALDAWPDTRRRPGEQTHVRCPKCRGLWLRY